MKIYIPTYLREDNQRCWKALPDSIKPMFTLVTHSGRASILAECNPGANIIDLGVTDGIASDDKVFIVDDGCIFMERDSELKLKNMEDPEKYLQMFEMVSTMLDNYSMVGISDRAGNNRVTEDYKTIGRAYSCYGVNRKVWRDRGITFDGMYRKNNEIKLYEDFYAILSMLTKGLPNAIIYKYAFNHPHGKPGGNSSIRTNELQRKCLEALRLEFPGLVELVKKEDPSWKAGPNDSENFRWEAVISWSKAFKQSESTASDFSEFFG